MQKLENILLEANQFFKKYNEEYPIALSTYNQITQTVDTALQQNDYALLLSQLKYLESGEGYLAFQYISEARCLLRILNIVDLEEKYQTSSFTSEIDTTQRLIEKYKLSLFSLRRIAFALSSESVADAEYFLDQNHLSPFAIYVLAKEELLIPDSHLFQKIQEIYHLQWTSTEIQLFHQLTSTFMEA